MSVLDVLQHEINDAYDAEVLLVGLRVTPSVPAGVIVTVPLTPGRRRGLLGAGRAENAREIVMSPVDYAELLLEIGVDDDDVISLRVSCDPW